MKYQLKPDDCCLVIALKVWYNDFNYRIWYNDEHAINMHEGFKIVKDLKKSKHIHRLEHYSFKHLANSFIDELSISDLELLVKYYIVYGKTRDRKFFNKHPLTIWPIYKELVRDKPQLKL